MAVIRLFVCGLLTLLACSCGQKITETLHIPEGSQVQLACPRAAVVLPFADYFYADDMRTGLIRNAIVMEYLVDRLVAKGVDVPVQEDVLQYLTDKKIITLLPQEMDPSRPDNTSSLVNELQEEWSESMKEEIRRYIAAEKGRSSLKVEDNEDLIEAPGMYALDKKNIREIGKAFNADYLVRGRIIEYYLRKGRKTTFWTFAPSQAIVHLRVWVQDTTSGEVVWTNRTEVKVSPQTEYGDDSPSVLFEAALSKAATTLVDDFWNKVNNS